MAGLQRSSGTFRRSGSSGLVWEWDDKHLSGEIRPSAAARRGVSLDGRPAGAPEARGLDRSRSSGHGGAARAPEAAAPVRVERSRSSGHRTGAGRVPPALDPPSPRVALCGGGFCGFFRGKGGGRKKKTKNDARKAKGKGRRH